MSSVGFGLYWCVHMPIIDVHRYPHVFLFIPQRIAIHVAESWLATTESDRATRATAVLEQGDDILASLREFNAPFMSHDDALKQEGR